jgi:hypothetical protein
LAVDLVGHLAGRDLLALTETKVLASGGAGSSAEPAHAVGAEAGDDDRQQADAEDDQHDFRSDTAAEEGEHANSNGKVGRALPWCATSYKPLGLAASLARARGLARRPSDISRRTVCAAQIGVGNGR